MQDDARVTVVTGTGSGIGRACALKMASLGDFLVINDVNDQKCRNTAKVISQKGGRAIAIPGDISKSEVVNEIIEEARQNYGPPDVMISSAGYLVEAELIDITDNEFDRMLEVHLRGTFLCNRAVLPSMLEKKHGSIINIASQLGQIGAAGLCHYCAAKAGIIGLTKSLAREVAREGVRVNAVAPGPINTALTDNLSSEWRRDKALELPLGRFGEPEEIADTVAFLASNEAKLYIGQTLGPNSGDVML